MQQSRKSVYHLFMMRFSAETSNLHDRLLASFQVGTLPRRIWQVIRVRSPTAFNFPYNVIDLLSNEVCHLICH